MTAKDPQVIKIPGYTVLKKIGSGAMAQVYLSVQQTLDRKVALKVMAESLSVDSEYSARFLREAKIVAQLSHPNIVAVYDVGVYDGRHYLSMEYHSRGDLKKKIRSGISVQEAIRISRQMAGALNFAHNEGYVHRDVKPENILFDRNNNAILTDFGIARSGDVAANLTAIGTIMGTPKYMSPEQAQGIEADGRSDLYSLGVMIFEMLTGRIPYNADGALAICQMHVSSPIPELPVELKDFQSLINRSMAKQPEDRFSSGAEIIEELDRLALSRIDAGGDDKTIRMASADMGEIHTLSETVPVSSGATQTVRLDNKSGNDVEGSLPVRQNKVLFFLVVGVAVAIGVYFSMLVPVTKPGNDQSLLQDAVATQPPIEKTTVTLAKKPTEQTNKVSDTLVSETQVSETQVSASPVSATPVSQTPDSATADSVTRDAKGKPAKTPVAIKTAIKQSSTDNSVIGSDTKGLLSSLQIMAPKNQGLCATAAPYRDGFVAVGAKDKLGAGDCFSVQVKRHTTVDLLIYSQSENGTIFRLIPNTCNAMGLSGKKHMDGDVVRFPLNAKQELAVIGLDDNAGTEWVYAIAVNDIPARQAVLSKFSSVPDVCSEKGGSLTVSEFQDSLATLNKSLNNDMQWLSQRFIHTAP